MVGAQRQGACHFGSCLVGHVREFVHRLGQGAEHMPAGKPGLVQRVGACHDLGASGEGVHRLQQGKVHQGPDHRQRCGEGKTATHQDQKREAPRRAVRKLLGQPASGAHHQADLEQIDDRQQGPEKLAGRHAHPCALRPDGRKGLAMVKNSRLTSRDGRVSLGVSPSRPKKPSSRTCYKCFRQKEIRQWSACQPDSSSATLATTS